MPRGEKGWGGRSAWALSFFDVVPPPTTITESDVHADDAAQATTAKQNAKLRRRVEADPHTQWRCRRCQSLLHPPLDVATGKPRSGVMMCEHLEGVSSGGTTHLATGVSVCTAGTLRYDSLALSASSSPSPLGASGSAKDGVTSTTAPPGQGLSPAAAARDDEARKEVLNLLRACQRAALADSRACSSISDGEGGGSSEREVPRVRPPVPLLFVVVENPKTPANAGGILRAMKCYGVRGPADGDASAGHQEEKVTESSSHATLLVNIKTATEGVPRRAGAFVFSGTRLRAAMAHSDFASTLRTDPTHAGRDIPQLCLSSLDVLFDVLRSDYGHRPSSSLSPSLVRVVAVELVEGATPLPTYAHPFCHHTGRLHETDASTFAVPMVFYVFGAEDGTLSAHHLDEHVDDVVFMPTTVSMNLAATVNVLLYDRISKECCGLTPAAAAGTVGDERAVGEKWRDVFESRNTNNRSRWTRQS